MDKLTPQQQQLVDTHYKMVSGLIRKLFKTSLKPFLHEAARDAGIDGLMKAAVGYRPEQGEFSTYAFVSIKNNIIRWWTEQAKNMSEIRNVTFTEMQSSPNLRNRRGTYEADIPERRENKGPTVAASVTEKLLPLLSEKSRFILEHSFGLNGKTKIRKKDIATALNMKETLLNYYYKCALSKLRKLSKEKNIDVSFV